MKPHYKQLKNTTSGLVILVAICLGLTMSSQSRVYSQTIADTSTINGVRPNQGTPLPPFSSAQDHNNPSLLSLSGDMPLTTLATFTGRADVIVKVVPQSFALNPSGTFTVSGIPMGGSIFRAYFITTSFSAFPTETATAVFAGTFLGTKSPDKTDPGGGLFLREYRYDVTQLVTGNGSYSYDVTGTNNVFGDALVIVFGHSSLPQRRIVINDGAESLQQAISTTSFGGFGTGVGRLLIFTQADNAFDIGGESLTFNGAIVLGPGDVYNGNQGDFASLIDIPVSVINGTNSTSVTTETDFFGLHLGVLVGPSLFDICLQDDVNSNLILHINSITGDYEFINCSTGLTVFGRGGSTRFGCIFTLGSGGGKKGGPAQVTAQVDTCSNASVATIRILPSGPNFNISDSNIQNNTCSCP